MIIETDRIYESIAWSNEDPYIRYDEVYRAIAEEREQAMTVAAEKLNQAMKESEE